MDFVEWVKSTVLNRGTNPTQPDAATEIEIETKAELDPEPKPEISDEPATSGSPEEPATMAVGTIDQTWDNLLAGAGRRRLETDALPGFLARQRWFAGKARAIQAVRIVDGGSPGSSLPALRFCFLDVEFSSGRSETYFVPLGVKTSLEAAELGESKSARIVGEVAPGILVYDALGDSEVGQMLLNSIGGNQAIRTDHGSIQADSTAAFERVRGPETDKLAVKAGNFEQSNSAIVYGDRLILKIFRRLEPGVNPDFEIGKFFAEKTKFNRVPTTAGSLIYQPNGGEPMMVGMLQGLVANEGTGWDHALTVLKTFYETLNAAEIDRMAATRCPRTVRDQIQWEPGDEVRDLVGPYLDDAATLGRRTAEMHLALAGDKADPAFRPEPLNADDLHHLSAEIHQTAETVRTALRAGLRALPAANQADAQTLLDGLPDLLGQVDAIAEQKINATKIRCHGDYHLGQVLRTGDDYILLDFEGEPAKTLVERLARQSAMKDVAGMIRSFDYAAFAALFAHAQVHPERFKQLAPVARFWGLWVASAFVREYLATVGDAGFIPKEAPALGKLLEVQLLDKALYELLYELNNRPDWVRIPLQGINALHASDRSPTSSSAPVDIAPQPPAKLEVAGLTDFDVYLLNEGTHYRAYERLGAHVGTQNGTDGVQFAVWAPNASQVSVIGDFNGWNPDANPMYRRGYSGFWETFVVGASVGSAYKYSVTSGDGNRRIAKADPYGFAAEVRPKTASVVADLAAYSWNDLRWMANRSGTNSLGAPISIYEVHLGSWMRTHDGNWLTYAELADKLGAYVHEMGYTHVELMPVAEHPFDGSWGYQITGYFAPTSRFGSPDDFKAFVDKLHQLGIGVILDWVPAHFPTDEHALGDFDGTHLYEHDDPRQGFHQDWNTYIFNFGRPEVANFLIANALFWLDKYHIDGLRVDAVASMLYRDYSRQPGEWVPNEHGGRENYEAITLIRRVNEQVHANYPGVLTIAEESTAWPKVSRPTDVGGLGFDLKWDLGWMHDTLHYFQEDPINRKYHHNNLTFRGLYAFTEHFVLPLSHDEVVYGKGSLLTKAAGDTWQKFASLRLLFGYMFASPGKKLMFMGDEFGQGREWDHDGSLQWHLLDDPNHAGLKRWVRDMNTIYRGKPALHELDTHPDGWRWVQADDSDQSVLSFIRQGHSSPETILFVANFTPVPRHNYRVGVPMAGQWDEIINSDAPLYGGSGQGNIGGVTSAPVAAHGYVQSLILTVPPLGIVALRSPGK